MTGLATEASYAPRVERRALRLDRRAAAAAGLGASLVLSVGLTDGGYYGHASTALALALAAVAALGAIHDGGLTRSGVASLGVLGAFVAWTAVSSTWAIPGALVEGEVRRAILYTSTLGALLLVIDARRRQPLLLGLLGGISLSVGCERKRRLLLEARSRWTRSERGAVRQPPRAPDRCRDEDREADQGVPQRRRDPRRRGTDGFGTWNAGDVLLSTGPCLVNGFQP
jgi:hypothetical protein